MILAHVTIENYKQYAGEHDIELPSVATIGVIGANGVGKTTLFEAIEWCLYNPTTIPNKEIRPRGRAGTTRVAVTVEDTATGAEYIVERELKRSSTQASVRRIEPDGEEAIIVQGARQVTEHVAGKLIGLSHRAFTATFFTRQKELHFFGDMGDTDRRREVGKLLGLETIRSAQQLIAEDRRRAANEAQVLRHQYDSQSKGRNFPEEIAAAERTIAASGEALAAAAGAVEQASAQLKTADGELAAQQALKDQDGTSAQRILALRGKLESAERDRQHIEADLARLAERERHRATLQPIAANAGSLREKAASLEQTRARAIRKREIETGLRTLDQRRLDHIQSLRSTVTALVPPIPMPGWAWDNEIDTASPDQAAQRLIQAIEAVDFVTIERETGDLCELSEVAREHVAETKLLDSYEAARRKIDNDITAILAHGDPATQLAELEQQRLKVVRQQSDIAAHRAQIDKQLQETRKLVDNLSEQHFDDQCPTCTRPFTADDVATVLDALQLRLKDHAEQRKELQRQSQELADAASKADLRRNELRKAQEDLARLYGRREQSIPVLDGQRQKVQDLGTRLTNAMRRLGRETPPSEQEISRANTALTTLRRIVDSRSIIERAHVGVITIARETAPLVAELATVADVIYDEAAHRQVVAEMDEANRAVATMEQIDRDLARRPQLEADLAACREAIATATAEVAQAERDRAAIGFDPAKLQAATVAVQAAREGERQAIEAKHRAETALREAEHAREFLIKEQERIGGLATQADECQRQHDQLDQMYREFTEFERYAAAWYAPKLSDITSELVSEVTDGKYDRVVFDNNFGIEIYDGDEEKFPLDTFSGGERDVIALCARIALSRVIGGQGTTPPGFVVLDEVFGSLDRDRRTRLLEMLGAITSQGESFRQVFIISHVDDVRTAPIFDELWQVQETDEGTSTINVLAPGTDIGEL